MMNHRFLATVLSGSLVAISALAAENLSISQKDKQFSKEEVTLASGDAIDFVNNDNVTHNVSVKAPDGTSKTSSVEKPGETVHVAFDQPGDWRVLCLVHPKMKMTVHVH